MPLGCDCMHTTNTNETHRMPLGCHTQFRSFLPFPPHSNSYSLASFIPSPVLAPSPSSTHNFSFFVTARSGPFCHFLPIRICFPLTLSSLLPCSPPLHTPHLSFLSFIHATSTTSSYTPCTDQVSIDLYRFI